MYRKKRPLIASLFNPINRVHFFAMSQPAAGGRKSAIGEIVFTTILHTLLSKISGVIELFQFLLYLKCIQKKHRFLASNRFCTYSSVRIPDYNAMSSRPRIHHADHPPVFCIGETPPQSISSDCSGNPLHRLSLSRDFSSPFFSDANAF